MGGRLFFAAANASRPALTMLCRRAQSSGEEDEFAFGDLGTRKARAILGRRRVVYEDQMGDQKAEAHAA
jgi:hypothetical protein